MRYMLTDERWAALGPLVDAAKRRKGGQPPRLPDRLLFEALLYVGRTGVPLRDLPAESGAWDAVYNRPRRWAHPGALGRLLEALTAAPAMGEVRRVLVDATTVRARRHAAGAGRRRRRSGPGGARRRRRSAAAGAG